MKKDDQIKNINLAFKFVLIGIQNFIFLWIKSRHNRLFEFDYIHFKAGGNAIRYFYSGLFGL